MLTATCPFLRQPPRGPGPPGRACCMSPMETAKGRKWTFTSPTSHLKVVGEGAGGPRAWGSSGRAQQGGPRSHALCLVLQPCLSSCSFTEDTGRAEGESGDVDGGLQERFHFPWGTPPPGLPQPNCHKLGTPCRAVSHSAGERKSQVKCGQFLGRVLPASPASGGLRQPLACVCIAPASASIHM